MKILLLGATGRTGRHVLEQALKRGHIVHALVRDRHKVNTASPNLHLFEGDPEEAELLCQAMSGTEAIISTLNISRTNDFPWSPLRTDKQFLSTVMKQLIRLAPEMNIRRVLFTSAWGVLETRGDLPAWFRWTIENSNIGSAYKDHEVQEELVAASELEWTAIRPVGLTNGAQKEAKVSINHHPKPGLIVSRRTVAAFILDCLEQGSYIRQKPVVYQ